MGDLEVYVCYGKERGTNYPHWILMIKDRNSNTGTWYHSIGGPTQNRPYQVSIQAGKRFDSHGISSSELIGTISSANIKKVNAAANRIQAQQCQYYVVALVRELEDRGILSTRGHAQRLLGRVQISAGAADYRRQHPVPGPGWGASSSSAAYEMQNLSHSGSSHGRTT